MNSQHTLLGLALLTASGCATPPDSGTNGDSVTDDARQLVDLTYGDGKALRLTVVRPDGAAPAGGYPVIFTLPPGNGSASLVETNLDLYWQAEAQRRGWVVVAPQVFGLDLDGSAAAVAASVFAWMDANLDYDAGRVVLTGASNGGRGGFYMILAAPERFAALMALPGFFDGDAGALEALRGKPVKLLVGENDATWRKFTEQTRADLESAGVDAEVEIVPDQSHLIRIDPAELFDWIESGV